MKQLLTWILSALLFAAIGGLCVWSFMRGGEKEEKEAHPEKPATTTAASTEPAEAPPVSRDKTGSVVVRMDSEIQQRVGLEVKPLEAATDEPEMVAFGLVQEDPAESFTLRAPLAGTVMASTSGEWVSFGKEIAVKTVIGGIVPRLGPLEQADLASRLATSRADEQGARASLDALRISLESKRKLHAQEKIVSDQTLQETEAKVKNEEARLQAARETIRILEAYISSSTRPADALPLIAIKPGRVVEVLVQPGETVEAGQAMVRLASFDRLFARVSLPAGTSAPKVVSARLVIANDEGHPIAAQLLSPASSADPVTGGQTFVFAFKPDSGAVQPGMPVAAHMKLAGEAAKGVMVPRDAIIRYVGAGWVYVKSGEESFTRREVPLTRLTPQGWFVPSEALSPQDEVVVRGAQSLMSEELKFEAGGGGSEEE
jgi:biotin carboxyl carrier protein